MATTFEILDAAMKGLLQASTLNEIQEIVRRSARRLCGADGATFVLRDGDNCYYADEEAIAPLWKGRRFPMSHCISGWVMLNKDVALIEDIYRDPRIPVDAYRPTFVKSLAMVPIRKSDPIGAIGTYWSMPHIPNIAEVRLLQQLADATATAMAKVDDPRTQGGGAHASASPPLNRGSNGRGAH
jgi:GAF domain-containing protein